MALVALTTDPSLGSPSVVTSSRNFVKDGIAILIQDGDIEQLRADSKDCNDGYDLRVGGAFRDHRNEYGQELDESGRIPLLPGNAVIIQTEEWVEFPDRRFGQIFPKVSLLQRGIANTPSKVDPGFRGNLLVTVFNYGKRTEYLGRRQRFCSLHVFDVEGPVRPYENRPPTIAARRPAAWPQKIGDWVDAYSARMGVVALVVSAVAAVLALLPHK
jgi:dCTP deaminase